MASKQTPDSTSHRLPPPKDVLAPLLHLSSLLHLLHHRNKNQHRHSIWWRHFSLFRKAVDRLVADLENLYHAVPATHLARSRKKAQDATTSARIIDRVNLWQDVMVARWQRAFSQLTADGRFAVLGLVVIGALAEFCKLTGIIAGLEELGQREVEKVLARFAEEEWEDGGGEASADRGVDLGEVLKREEHSDNHEDAAAMPMETGGTMQPVESDTVQQKRKSADIAAKPPQKRKKRKKGGDAIDDLFSCL